MAVGRSFRFPQIKTDKKLPDHLDDHWRRRVVEHEMDMPRMGRQSTMLGWLIDVARRLMGLDPGRVGPPRRAIERESEEAWPSRE